MNKNILEFFKLEDRMLFEAAAVAEIAEAMDNDPNADMNENDRQAQDEKNAIKNAPVENAESAGRGPVNSAQPGEKSGIDAEIQSLVEGEIGAPAAGMDAVDDMINEFFNDYGANMVNDTIQDVFAESDEPEYTVINSDTTVSTGNELVIINSSVKDVDKIIGSLAPNQEYLVLESGKDAMQQINDYLDANGSEYDAIHIVSHGNKGYIVLAGEVYNAGNFDAADWAAVGEHLSEGGDILFYGCNLAENEAGKDFISMVADASGADVAASTNTTGFGGDWVLEYHYGNIEAISITVDSYDYRLNNWHVTLDTDDGVGSHILNGDNNEGTYELRYAVNNALSGDEITFADNVTEIQLKSAISINKNLTITGNFNLDGDAITTIIAANNQRVFSIGSGYTVELDNLIMTGKGTYSGNGGVIWGDGNSTLTLVNSTVRNGSANEGGGIWSYGSINLTNSTIANNGSENTAKGGGIFLLGTLTVKDSTFTGNTAKSGGAIYGYGDGAKISINGGEFESNKATAGEGGAIYGMNKLTVTNSIFGNATDSGKGNSARNGGAIYASNGAYTLEITNSKFYGNAAIGGSGGAVYGNGAIEVTNAVFDGNTANGNGGAIRGGSTLTLESTTIQNGSANEGGGAWASKVTLSKNSVITGNTAGSKGGGIFSVSDLNVSNSEFSYNRVTGSGANYGGGAIYVHSDATSATVTDSNFYDNTAEKGDGGAIFSLAHLTVSSTVASPVLFENNRAANGSGGAIYAGRDLSVTNAVFGNASNSSRNNSARNGGAIYANGGGFTVTIANGKFYDSIATSDGGAIYSKAHLILSNSVFAGSHANNGGTLYLNGSLTASITNVSISGSYANGNGGTAFVSSGATLNINSGVVFDNSGIATEAANGGLFYVAGKIAFNASHTFSGYNVTGNGGVLYLSGSGSRFEATDGVQLTFADNTAVKGGAIYSETNLTLGSGHAFTGNKASGDGGAIYNSGDLTVTGVLFASNTASGNGGAIYAGRNLTVTDAVFGNATDSGKANSANNGGAIYANGGGYTVTVANGKFYDSAATSDGGAIYSKANLILSNSVFAGSHANNGGTLYLNGSLTASITNASISGSYANGNGGTAFVSSSATLNINNGVVFDNSGIATEAANGGLFYVAGKIAFNASHTFSGYNVTGNGGVLYLSGSGSRFEATDGVQLTFADNTAVKGGAIYSETNLTLGSGHAFTGNKASGDGGAIYNSGDLTVTGVLFASNTASGNGGAIYAGRNLTVTDAVFGNATDSGKANSANNGGAIYANGGGYTVTVNNSEFYYSEAAGDGGAIYSKANLTLDNKSVFTGNHAANGGTLYLAGSSVVNINDASISGSYASGNGGTAFVSSGVTLNINNADVFDNSGVTTAEAANGGLLYVEGKVVFNASHTFSGYNVTGDGGVLYLAAGSGFTAADGVQLTFENNTAVNGGAIYTEIDLTLNSGYKFTGNGASGDGGAIFSHASLTVTRVVFDGNTASGNGGAIRGYNVVLNNSTFKNGSANEGGAVWGYNIDVLNQSIISNNTAMAKGGGIFSVSNLKVSDSDFTGNKVTGTGSGYGGGAIYAYANGNGDNLAEIVITNSNFYRNTTANGDGGAIYSLGDLKLTGMSFENNTAVNGNGGAVYASRKLTVSNVIFGNATEAGKANSAKNGGAIYTYSHDHVVTITDSDFHYNSAYYDGDVIPDEDADKDGSGGAIFIRGELNVSGSIFENNTASNDGGAIYARPTDRSATITNSEFNNNTTTKGDGGAIYSISDLTVNGATFDRNTAGNSGGAVYARGITNMTISSAQDLIFQNNTATNGDGGAIYGNAALTVTGAIFHTNIAGNRGGAVYSFGDLTVKGTIFDGNTATNDGGAVFGQNTMTMTDLTFRNNKTVSGHGGAIFSYGDLSLTGVNSTVIFENNTAATGDGGAIYAVRNLTISNAVFGNATDSSKKNSAANGGAIFIYASELAASITDSRFYYNEATNGDGGAIYNLGTALELTTGVVFTSNTASGNGGAILSNGKLTLSSLDFHNNTAVNGDGGAVFSNGDLTVTSAVFENNTADNGNGGAIFANGALTVTAGTFGKLTDSSKANSAKNGGAIYASNSSTTATVNGQFYHNEATAGDGGAIFSHSTLILTGAMFQSNTAYDKGGAVFANNSLTANAATAFNGNSAQNGGAIYIYNPNVTVAIDSQFFYNAATNGDGGAIYSGSDLSLSGALFHNNTAMMNGGAVFAGQALTVMGGVFTSNTASGDGGAIYSSGALSLSGTEFYDNTATMNGGAVFANRDLTVTDSKFEDNTASNGGAVFAHGKEYTASVSNSQFYYNEATNSDGGGGAIYSYSTLELTDAAFEGNTTSGSGGAVFATGNLTVTTSTFGSASDDARGNTAKDGGAIHAHGREYTATITDSQFYHNRATNNGGAVFSYATLDLNGATFENNNAAVNGGALYLSAAATIAGTVFTGNQALNGGAVYADSDLTTDATTVFGAAGDSTKKNSANNGGAIYVNNSSATVRIDGEFHYNEASVDGGAIFSYGKLEVTGAFFDHNTADRNGGAIYGGWGSITVSDSTIQNGKADEGGAVWGYNIEVSDNSIITGNTASFKGGAIFAIDGLKVSDSEFTNNTVSGGSDELGGGAIYAYVANSNFYTATIENSQFSNNSVTDGNGGAIYSLAQLTVSGNTVFENNTAGNGNGGALYLTAGAKIAETAFTGNTADLDGGAIYAAGGTVNINAGNTFTDSSAGRDGGIVYIASGATLNVNAQITLSGSAGRDGGTIYSAGALNLNAAVTFVNGYAGNKGGALYLADGSTFSQTAALTFAENQAEIDGGAVYSQIGLTVYGSFTGNQALNGNGGAIYGEKSVTVLNSEFNTNTAELSGGAIYGAGDVNVTRGTFISNQAQAGAGGAVYAGGKVMVTHSEFRNNSAALNGGAVYVGGDSATMDNTLIADNTATGNGGAIYFANAAVAAVLTNLTIVNNTAASGGGIYTLGSNVTLRNSILWGNKGNQYVGLDNTKVWNSGIQGWAYNDYAARGNVNLQADNSADGIGIDNLNETGKYYICFVDEANGDYHLNLGSYAINRGSNSFVSMPETDLDGANRIQYGFADMGAYESKHLGNVVVSGDGTHLEYGNSGYLSAGNDGYGTGGYNYTSRDSSAVIVDKNTGKATAVWADESVIIDVEYQGDANWNSRTTQVTVTTEQRDLVIKAGDETHTYDGTNHNLNWNGDKSGYVLDDNLESWYNAAYRNFGTYTGDEVISDALITSSTRGDVSSNYRITYEGTLTINKATLVITGDSGGFTYDGTYHDYSYTTNGGLVSGDDIKSIIGDTNSYRNAGTYGNLQSEAKIFNADGEDMSDNYFITYESGTVTVSKATLVITGDSGEFTYDGTYHDYSYTTNGGLVSGDGIKSITGDTNSYRNAGTYGNLQSEAKIYNADGEDMNGNYDITYKSGTVTVNKAKLVIVIDDKTKTERQPDPVFTGTANGLIGSDTVTGYNRTDKSEAEGQHIIDQYQLNTDDSGNYEVTVVTGTLTILGEPQINIYSDASSRNYVINGMDQASLMNAVSTMTANRDVDAVLDTENDGNLSSASHQTTAKATDKARTNTREDSQKKTFEQESQQVAQQRSNTLLVKSGLFADKAEKSIVESQFKTSEKGGVQVQVPANDFSAKNTSFESDHPMHTMPSNVSIDASGVNVINFSGADLADISIMEKVEGFKDDLDLLLEEMIIV